MERCKRNEHGFLWRIIVFVLSLFAFIGLVGMGLSVLCSYVDPSRFVWLSFFGLAFWEILLYNIIVMMLLFMLKTRKVWIAILAVLLAIPGIAKSYSYGKPEEGGELCVMSYNVQNFKHIKYPERAREDVAFDIAKMVRDNDVDLLCIQEFASFSSKKSRNECIRSFSDMLNLPYVYYHTKDYFCGNVIFSKYPVSALTDSCEIGKEKAYGAIAHVDAGEKGSFDMLCAHLTSYHLTDEEVNIFTEKGNAKENVETYGKSIISKLRVAFTCRSAEVNMLLSDLQDDNRNLLLCGDFNDTPLSYTYQQIKKAGYSDSFVAVGKGIGTTYAGKLPLLRIDYLWTNSSIQPKSFTRLRFKGSDHYPVMMRFDVNH